MNVIRTTPGEIDPTHHIDDPWGLIFGGVTLQGERRTKRAIATALQSGVDVLWFNGCETTLANDEIVSPRTAPASNVVIVECWKAESRSLTARMRSGRSLHRNRLARSIAKSVVHRLGTMLRSRERWKVIRVDVQMMASHNGPSFILCADDTAITSAWHAARLWPAAAVDIYLPSSVT